MNRQGKKEKCFVWLTKRLVREYPVKAALAEQKLEHKGKCWEVKEVSLSGRLSQDRNKTKAPGYMRGIERWRGLESISIIIFYTRMWIVNKQSFFPLKSLDLNFWHLLHETCATGPVFKVTFGVVFVRRQLEIDEEEMYHESFTMSKDRQERILWLLVASLN
jgi:hypothetical protein